MNWKSNKVPEPFIAPGSEVKPTQEEIEKRKLKMKRAEEIGACFTKIDEEQEFENPYRVEALIYINKGKEVPLDLKLKIKKYDEMHMKKCK